MEEGNKLRAIGVNTVGWKYAKEYVDANNVHKDFVVLLNRREIRKGNVNKLRKLLVNGEHFETPFVCNKKNGKWRLIDGNHRHEAIMDFLDEFPKRRVEVGICYYEGLNEDEEKQIFTKWNLGTKQNLNDFIQQYWTDIPITKKLSKPNFPVNIRPRWSGAAMELKQLLGPYIVRNSTGEHASIMHRRSAMDFIEKSQELGDKDARVLKQFMNEFVSIFGFPDRANPMYRASPFVVTMRIWLQNYQNVPPTKMKKRLSKLRGSERAIFWSTQGASRTNVVQALRDFHEVVNKGIHSEDSKLK